jgi:hypothetical protein
MSDPVGASRCGPLCIASVKVLGGSPNLQAHPQPTNQRRAPSRPRCARCAHVACAAPAHRVVSADVLDGSPMTPLNCTHWMNARRTLHLRGARRQALGHLLSADVRISKRPNGDGPNGEHAGRRLERCERLAAPLVALLGPLGGEGRRHDLKGSRSRTLSLFPCPHTGTRARAHARKRTLQ